MAWRKDSRVEQMIRYVGSAAAVAAAVEGAERRKRMNCSEVQSSITIGSCPRGGILSEVGVDDGAFPSTPLVSSPSSNYLPHKL